MSCQVNFQDVDDRLIKSTKEFVAEDNGQIDDQYGTLQEYEKQNLKVEYLTDTIYAQAMQYVNACGDAVAWIEFKGDTLILTTKEQGEIQCTSASYYKYEYWIKNPKNKKFIIIQK
jgi:hypothetical protein